MRFWISKNNGVPVREQLVRQVMLGILSGDLAVGKRLPSAKTLARLHGIHPNTVIAAFQELQDRGMIEARRGSGLYVLASPASEAPGARVDTFLAAALETAKSIGMGTDQLTERLRRMAASQPVREILVHDAEPELAEILCGELREAGFGPVRRLEEMEEPANDTLVVWLAHRAIAPERKNWRVTELKLRSVPGSIAGQARPAQTATVTVVTASQLFWRGAQAYLSAVGVDAGSLRHLDPRAPSWRERLDPHGILIVDLLSGAQLPASSVAKLFRLIADSSIEELQGICTPHTI